MAGTPAENQQRRAEEATCRRRIRTSLRESFQADDDDCAEPPINPQLAKAFENLCDHALS